MEKDRNIGFIGLGIMGKPMAENIINAGYKLHIFSTNETTTSHFEKMGAKTYEAPALVAEMCDIIITMLPDTPQVEGVVFGNGGVIHGVKPGALLIDMSTIDAEVERNINVQLLKKGASSLDAPVSGGQQGAVDGVLSIMVGGSKGSFQRALPLLETMGSRIIHIGGSGSGQIAKSCNQIATALATQGVVEALTLARLSGIDLALVREALLGGFAFSKALEVAGKKMIENEFEPGFTLQLYSKDLRIANKTAKTLGLGLPGASLLQNEMEQLIKNDMGALDFSALIKIFE